MAQVELTEYQTEALIDALSNGVVEAINELKRQCPELEDYVIRALLFKYFRTALVFEGKGLLVDVGMIRKD